MNYELAKKLKEAGFIIHTQDKAIKSPNPELNEWIDIPTLSELIEACKPTENSFFRLGLSESGWMCRDISLEGQKLIGYKTPEEAVAELWLMLNKK